MTSTPAIFLALSLLINNVNLLYESCLLEDGHFVTKIVYVLSVCLIIRELPMFPRFLWRNYSSLCFLSEMAITLVMLECSLTHVWKYLEDYVLLHADDFLLQASAIPSTEWLVCHICCGRSECTEVFAQLLLKTFSFLFLFCTCVFTVTK